MPKRLELPDYDTLHDCFEIGPIGLIRKGALYGPIKTDGRVGSTNSKGYRNVYIAGKIYLEHRIMWKMHYGEEPPEYIDHINEDKDDNRIENLQSITNSANKIKGFKTSPYKRKVA